MINISSLTSIIKTSTFITKYRYHIDDLMKTSYAQRKSVLFAPAIHLYIDKLKKMDFDEKRYIITMIEL